MAQPRKVQATLENIVQFGPGVYSLTFSVEERYTRFNAGQFLHLTLDDFDPTTGFWPESRVFSIASAPNTNHIQIVYSVKGVYTKRMERELTVGKSYWVKLPYGDFSIDRHASESDTLVLIAGGTGVAPYVPFLLKRDRVHPEMDIHLYYGVREYSHFLFLDQFKLAVEHMPNLSVHLFQEKGEVNSPVLSGSLNIDAIFEETQNLKAKYFISGPPGMIKAFTGALSAKGVGSNSIIIDEWE